MSYFLTKCKKKTAGVRILSKLKIVLKVIYPILAL